MPLADRVKNTLEELYLKGRIRSLAKDDPSTVIDLSSNDYLGLTHNEFLRTHFQQQSRTGASASRVLCPVLPAHEKLEKELAECTGMESALLYGSGYLANIGVLSSLISRNDFVLSDKYVHASLLDGIRLSGARHFRVRHNCTQQYEQRLKMVQDKRKPGQEVFLVTESVFSMDGDIAPLRDLYELAERNDAFLVVDEAHAIGVYGRSGGGVVSESELSGERILLLGTLSKSLGSYGGFVCGKREIIDYLVNTSRSFIFSTALPEVVVQSALTALILVRENPGWGRELLKNAEVFKNRLISHGIDTAKIPTHIVPVHTGDEVKTMDARKALREKGIIVSGIRPPTVPPGTSRLRCSISLTHTHRDLENAADEIAKVLLKD
jgi:8-amino-7-oxononanoate synthase